MGTAKDDLRKSIIQESLNSLSSPDRRSGGGITQNAFETEKVFLLHDVLLNVNFSLRWEEIFLNHPRSAQ